MSFQKNAHSRLNVYAKLDGMDLIEKEKLVELISLNTSFDVDAYCGDVKVISTANQIEIDTLAAHLALLVNLTKINNIRWLNRFFLSAHKKLHLGGWIVVKYQSLEVRKMELLNRLPKALFLPFYYFDFFFHRVFPRLRHINSLYFMITKGKNRVLSKAEVWGRLHYCGFEVLDEVEVGKEIFLIAQKTQGSSQDENPSYYPFIKLDRIGFHGEIIKIHKLRTMHPYSEYIQNKVYELTNLGTSGKFKDDFRITGWGKVLRKYWLDELPQIIDLLCGKIKLVGIRAMSKHYFSLYPKEYQEMFVKVKPGLLAPLFDENTSGFDEIVEVEGRYLKKYLQNPVKTDIEYFWKTVAHIFFKGTRSQ